MSRIAIICGDGIGGSILGQQCAHFAQKGGEKVKVFYAADDDKFRAIKLLFPDTIQIPESYQQGNVFEKDSTEQESFNDTYGPFDEIYYVVPDLLFQNSHRFPYEKYGVSPQVIKQTRLLTQKREFVEKSIYVGLFSTTPGYSYEELDELLNQLGETFPNYRIYFPYPKEWAGHKKQFDFSFKRTNIKILNDLCIEDAIDLMSQCEYGIFTDNGMNNIAYQFGMPKLILDPRLGQLPWIARWRQSEEESIPIDTPPQEIVNIVKLNIDIPETLSFDRKYLIGNTQRNWRELLLMKKY